MQKSLLLLALIAPLASFAVPAAAEDEQSCTTEPAASWIGEDIARSKATELGYDVRDLKTEGTCYEIYAMKDGQRVQLVMNPADGAMVGNEEGEEGAE